MRIQSLWRGKKERAAIQKENAHRRPLGYYTHELAIVTPGWKAKNAESAKQKAYLLLEDPSSSKYAQGISIAILSIIVISIVCFILEKEPLFFYVPQSFWEFQDTMSTMVFTAEYVTKFLVCGEGGKTTLQFVRSPMNMIDLAAIVPFFVEIIIKSLGSTSNIGFLRALRAVRLIRLFKLTRYNSGFKLMAEALKASSQALSILLFFLSVSVVLSSSLMYYAEKMSCPNFNKAENPSFDEEVYEQECGNSYNRGVSPSFGLCCYDWHSHEWITKKKVWDAAPGDFPHIPKAMWWSIVTMTTVGYGDIKPKTAAGKVVGGMVIMVGMVLIALPVAIVGQKFQEAYENQHDRSRQREAQQGQGKGGESGPEKVVLSPESSLVEKLNKFNILDENLAEQVASLTGNLDDTWNRRARLSREHSEEMNRQRITHRTFLEFIESLRTR